MEKNVVTLKNVVVNEKFMKSVALYNGEIFFDILFNGYFHIDCEKRDWKNRHYLQSFSGAFIDFYLY